MEADGKEVKTGALNPEMRGQVGNAIAELIEASRKHQSEWRSRGRQVMKYYHRGASKDEFAHVRGMNEQKLFHRSVLNKTFEAVSVLGPLIRPTNPYLEIFPDEYSAPEETERLKVDERYINSTSATNGQTAGMRQSVIPFLAYGRAIARPGVPLGRRGVIGTRYYDPESYYFDPSAKQEIDISWKALMEPMKKVDAEKKWPDAAPLIKDMKAASEDNSAEKSSIDMVDVIEFWTTLPLSKFNATKECSKALKKHFDGKDKSKNPLKYIVATTSNTAENAVLLDVQPWEVPLYQIDEWPIVTMDSYEDEIKVGCLPVSTLFPAITYQVAMNKISTLLMQQYKNTSTLIFGKVDRSRSNTVSEKAMDKVRLNGLEAVLSVTGNNAADIRRTIQQFKYDYSYIDASIKLIEYFEQKFTMITGVHGYLQTGDPAKQDRSAQASQNRQRAAYTRVNDLRNRMAGAEEKIGRINAISLRYLKDREHIDKILGPTDAEAYGILGTEDEQNPAFWLQQMTGGDIQALGMMDEEQRMQLMQAAQEKASQFYTMEEVFRQTAFKIRTGSDVVPDRQERLAHLERQSNQLMPTLLDPNNPPEMRAVAFEQMALHNRELGYEDLAQTYDNLANILRQPPAPPMPPPSPDGIPGPMPQKGAVQ